MQMTKSGKERKKATMALQIPIGHVKLKAGSKLIFDQRVQTENPDAGQHR
jgi:hypothetical protein